MYWYDGGVDVGDVRVFGGVVIMMWGCWGWMGWWLEDVCWDGCLV